MAARAIGRGQIRVWPARFPQRPLRAAWSWHDLHRARIRAERACRSRFGISRPRERGGNILSEGSQYISAVLTRRSPASRSAGGTAFNLVGDAIRDSSIHAPREDP